MRTILLILFVPLVSTVHSQDVIKLDKDKEEALVKEIREKYKLINSRKKAYHKEETFWSYENDGLDNDSEYENNEDGNEEITNTVYSDNGQELLHVCYKHMYKYQVPYSKSVYSEAYYWEGEIFFIYEQIVESLERPDYGRILEFVTDLEEGTQATENRFYYTEDKVFRVLRKNIEFIGNRNIDSFFKSTPNTHINLDSLSFEDFPEDCNSSDY